MLSMSRINYIKEKYEFEGKSISEIQRETGHSRDTIRKLIDTDYNEPKKRAPRIIEKKIDPYIDLIREWLENDLNEPRKQRHTAQRVFERLLEETDFDGKIRIVQMCVRELKDEIYGNHKMYLSLSRPDTEAQVDFGEVYYYDSKGIKRKGHELVLAFPTSNASYTQLLPAQNQECLFHGLNQIFRKLNGVPRRMVFDNMSTAVAHVGNGKDRTLTDEFIRFKIHYGFDAVFCNKASGNEKPHAEINVGYLRRNLFVPVPKVDDFDAFNSKLFNRCDCMMQRKHYNLKIPIIDLLSKNKKVLSSLPKYEFNVGIPFKTKANKNSYIRFENTYYSTKPVLVGKSVWVKVTYDKVIILDNDHAIIDVHERKYDETKEVVNWINYLPVIAKRPTALKYTAFYESLPNVWKMTIDEFNDEDLKQLLLEYGEKLVSNPESLTLALEHCINKGTITLDYFKLALRSESDVKNKVIDLPDYVPNIGAYTIDLKDYDSFIGGHHNG
jgi:transposase